MPLVQFADDLARFFPGLGEVRVEGSTVAEVIRALEDSFLGLPGYLVDEQGVMRPHVNIYVGDDLVRDRRGLSDAVAEGATIFVFQALSGG
jgi:molybdopterin synthase sulfur carrier subunit